MQKKIVYIISSTNKAQAFEWIADAVDSNVYTLSYILLHSEEPYLYRWLKEKGVECYFIPHNGKRTYLRSFFKVFFLLKKIKPDIVHTHLFDANLIGLLAAKFAKIKKRIYTRHHSTYHHLYYPRAVKYDRWINRLSTDVVAISVNVKNVLRNKEQVSSKKIHLIQHGFDLKSFDNIPENRIDKLRKTYNISNTSTPVIGVIARHIEWKGIQFIIPAFKQIIKDFPNALLILANAKGPYKLELDNLLKSIDKKNYVQISFEDDLFALYQLFQIYVHTPVNAEIEAFGQTYVESLASGVPSVFTMSGVAPEFIENRKNALVVDYENSQSIYDSIKLLIEDKELANNIVKEGRKSLECFELRCFIKNLEKLYSE